MIYGIGTDIVSLKRIIRLNKKFGLAFAQRILSPEELLEFPQAGKPVNYLAKRFAAKEAFAKAVGTGIRGVVSFRNIGVGHDALGKPELFFAPVLSKWLEEQGIHGCHLSMSDEEDTVMAFV
ncbi:MAG: holo-ACP synthase, partial [Neisseria sp.]